ncbi:2-succinyl-5-enolpyruvyl-6-hydroxy-3-cyclohexene-1-carboxylic-acid synthase [Siphonobacter aquaeclarae]|uniref:2-succinyl-5-enolpyruvyl-6-hydroxy-3-cyclohexene-1-carboxylate synthase n=1 Tax=Siphonobacter aquaeclarae TaxID=563176 RepID=A0A1G9RPI4_9BACT|nr:2-succinyl-5-enolpyruvyl-6-hydroxy-3-cyclohexene-1-carboxylic-acid synthase [Siphonobacter aquaeclarae]SDM25104.1 2-succinyl-5-enolpyruvyl-6-hydroxy-3-cyclohexene-1-carboxylate synthase [Siphonobacter aquaeclarae]
MILQPLLDLVALCAERGIRHVVISPGSRSAALTLAFARHSSIQTKVIPDERSAGYVALGMAQQLQEPVAVVCTSGTAASNLVPAVTEAFFLGIPLLVLTADRPPEWIGQQDGQMIYQRDVFGKHVKKAFELPADYTHPDALWSIERQVNEAINLAGTAVPGPVHINVPIREPFYPTETEVYRFGRPRQMIRVGAEPVLTPETWAEIAETLERHAGRILIAAGQLQGYSSELTGILEQLRAEFGIPIVGDIISNIHQTGTFVSHQDYFLPLAGDELQPDLLITFGDSFISKNIKLYFRKHKPFLHWHLSLRPELIDPFQTLTHQFPVQPEYFFRNMLETLDMRAYKDGDEEPDSDLLARWEAADMQARKTIFQAVSAFDSFGELAAVAEVLDTLPEPAQLHLANSLSVRYANFLGLRGRQVTVLSNRGTSGIDGCLSTAVGAALVSDEPVYLLIGDVAFFYDRNALWHPQLPANLRIVLLNNSGGSIFRMIDGPARQPELGQYFETRHHTSAERVCADAGIDYFPAGDEAALRKGLSELKKEGDKPKLLEISTDPERNQKYFAEFKAAGKRS